jgi:hypothetical protein
MNHSRATAARVAEPAPPQPTPAHHSVPRLLALIATGLLVLALGLCSSVPTRSSDEQPRITGPVAWLLTASTDLGPARRQQIQLLPHCTVLLARRH